MTLRVRLILAFVLLSVLPLTAVTLISYRSSLDALHRTAEEQASVAAGTLAKRMDTVTKNISRQLEKLSELPSPAAAEMQRPPVVPADSKSAAKLVTVALGQSADLLDRLEFVAVSPSAPAPPLPPGQPATPGHVSEDVSPTVSAKSLEPIVVDISKLSRALGADPAAAGISQEELKAQAAALQFVTRLVSAGIKIGEKEMVTAAEAKLVAERAKLEAAQRQGRAVHGSQQGQAEASAGGTAPATPPPATPASPRPRPGQPPVKIMRWAGEAVGVPVRRAGNVVGTVNATVNLDRVLNDVLSMTAGDAKEIPFAVGPDRKVRTLRPQDEARLADINPTTLADSPPGTRRVRVKQDWIVVTRTDPTGVTFGIARPLGEPLREIRRAAGRNLSLGLTLIGLALVGIVPLSGRMTRNLKTLTTGTQQIARGDLTVRIPVRSRDEFGRLAGAFNQMAADLEAHQQVLVTQERMQRELELCRQIQNEMLPREALRLDLAEVRGVSIPAREVGGDFFNYFVLGDHEVALLVGDVAGKGVGAALLMANIQATLQARLPLERDLAKLADAIDREIERTTPRPVYLTLFVGILDLREKTLRYVNAGHNPQFILRAAGGVQRLPSTGLPVGMFAGHGYQERTEVLAEGDLLFFYTDGMTEVENEAGDFFDIQQLEALLVAEHSDDIDTLLARVEKTVRTYRGGAEALDDATMMALRFGATRGKGGPRPSAP